MPHARADSYHAEDESYFVSMTDLLVGMLFIFIIVLMAFALNLKDQQQKFDEATALLQNANLVRVELLQKLQKSLLEQGVPVLIDLQNGILRLPEKVLFRQGDYRLDAEGESAIGKLATHLADLLPAYACVRTADGTTKCPTSARLETIFIEGHTDNVPISGRLSVRIADNWELSARRAISVYQKLTAVRPDLETFETERSGSSNTGKAEKLLGVSGYAERRPVALGDSNSARAENRRIDLRFIMTSPNPEDAKKLRESIGAAPVGP